MSDETLQSQSATVRIPCTDARRSDTPAPCHSFLDVTGKWEPTLGFVMAGALAVFMPSYPLVMRRARPVAAEKFDLQNAGNGRQPRHTHELSVVAS